jgi:hypothetical protein
MDGLSLGFELMSEVAFKDAVGFQSKSSIGLPHSKTLSRRLGSKYLRQVLECGSPMPLFDWFTVRVPINFLLLHASRITHHVSHG